MSSSFSLKDQIVLFCKFVIVLFCKFVIIMMGNIVCYLECFFMIYVQYWDTYICL